jgi:hypothetical protein
MPDLIVTHFLDITNSTLLTDTQKPNDLGWGALPGPLQSGMRIFINDATWQVAGFVFRIETQLLTTDGQMTLKGPIMELYVNEPGKAPKVTGLVGAPAGALDRLKAQN